MKNIEKNVKGFEKVMSLSDVDTEMLLGSQRSQLIDFIQQSYPELKNHIKDQKFISMLLEIINTDTYTIENVTNIMNENCVESKLLNITLEFLSFFKTDASIKHEMRYLDKKKIIGSSMINQIHLENLEDIEEFSEFSNSSDEEDSNYIDIDKDDDLPVKKNKNDFINDIDVKMSENDMLNESLSDKNIDYGRKKKNKK